MKYFSRCLFLAILYLASCRLAVSAGDDHFARHWEYASETSAVIYWQVGEIKNAAESYVEYGKTKELGRKTDTADRFRWAQLHRLKGLETGVTYYYRMVNIDKESGEIQRSGIRNFTTERKKEAVRIPQDFLSGPPYILDKPDTYYILTRDITAPGTAIETRARNVTLDLDGHTVTFGNDTPEQAYGVRLADQGGSTLCNGRIVQGARSRDYSAAVASLKRPEPSNIFGISTDVHLPNAYPMKFSNASKFDIHHNHLYSRVTEIECRHFPGNCLMEVYTYGGEIHIHDNLLTEGCHRGLLVRVQSRTARDIEIEYNDIQHHQQYVNGYALAARTNANLHHNKVTSTGRGVHLTGDGTLFHDNYIDIQGHMHLSDLPARTRPFHHRMIELHGIKFEGRYTRNCKIYNNFVRIIQKRPVDSDGLGDPGDKVNNGVYIRSTASSLGNDRLVDTGRDWETDRWKGYYVKYSPSLPPAKIIRNDATTLFADFEGADPGEYSIYIKWSYVAPTPLNLACYDPNGMNEIYNNEFIGLTTYQKTRHGDYGDSGEWATAIMFVGMNRGPAEPGKYSAYIHDNRFVSNDLFLNGYEVINMDIRIEDNAFTLVKTPLVTERESRFRTVGPAFVKKVETGKNMFEY